MQNNFIIVEINLTLSSQDIYAQNLIQNIFTIAPKLLGTFTAHKVNYDLGYTDIHPKFNCFYVINPISTTEESDNSSNFSFIKDVTTGSFLIVFSPFQKKQVKIIGNDKVFIKKKFW